MASTNTSKETRPKARPYTKDGISGFLLCITPSQELIAHMKTLLPEKTTFPPMEIFIPRGHNKVGLPSGQTRRRMSRYDEHLKNLSSGQNTQQNRDASPSPPPFRFSQYQQFGLIVYDSDQNDDAEVASSSSNAIENIRGPDNFPSTDYIADHQRPDYRPPRQRNYNFPPGDHRPPRSGYTEFNCGRSGRSFSSIPTGLPTNNLQKEEKSQGREFKWPADWIEVPYSRLNKNMCQQSSEVQSKNVPLTMESIEPGKIQQKDGPLTLTNIKPKEIEQKDDPSTEKVQSKNELWDQNLLEAVKKYGSQIKQVDERAADKFTDGDAFFA